MTIIDTINALASEWAQLYRALQARPDDDGALLCRLREVNAELADLWDQRRGEKADKYECAEYVGGNGKAYIVGHLAWGQHTSGGRRPGGE